jgi:putative heme transporter
VSPRRVTTERLRPVVIAVGGLLLTTAVWVQRETIRAALGELVGLSALVATLLVLLASIERVVRAGIIRRLLPDVTFGRAMMIHDVGASASRGIPLGGPIALGLRYSITRDAGVSAPRCLSALVAFSVTGTFVTWLWPLAVLVVDLGGRTPTSTDVAMLTVCVVVVVGAASFWGSVLGSDRFTSWIASAVGRTSRAVGRRVPTLRHRDPAGTLVEIRASLQQTVRRPAGLLLRIAVAQVIGAVILLLALRDLGVGAELGTVEFARVFFVVMLLSNYVPVPGGVGVVEAGLTGALVAAGVEAPTALAAVLVYRLFTYVTPIVTGAVLYGLWRYSVRRRRTASTAAAASHPAASPVPAPVLS